MKLRLPWLIETEPAAKPATKPKAPVAAPKPAAQAPSGQVESLWAKPEAPRPMWGAAPSSSGLTHPGWIGFCTTTDARSGEARTVIPRTAAAGSDQVA